MTRLLAIVLNVWMLGGLAWLIAKNGISEDAGLVLQFTVTALVSLVALAILPGKNWLGLYWRRKALEEEQRIQALDQRQAADLSSKA